MTIRHLALALIAGWTLTGAAIAAPEPAVPAATDAVTGVLRRIAYSDRELVVVGPGAKGQETETTIAVPETARIVKNGKGAKLDDLKEGETATVQVEQKEGRPSAVAVQVGAAAAPPRRAANAIPRVRLLLKVADQILQGMEKRNREP